VAQVACFDTAFHTTIPPAASTYALPRRLRDLGVRVYGFHGLSHAWVSARAAEQVPGARRVLVAHLGAGASLCAVLDGRSIDTTMGFTPGDGLVMATRSGALDPGAVSWLASHTSEDLTNVLERESGLLGLCGAADMREVMTRANSGEGSAQLALEVWWHRLIRLCGAMAAALGGLDVLALTGGIGEHNQAVRTGLIDRLAWLGSGSTTPVLVVPAREDLQVAAETTRLLSSVRSDQSGEALVRQRCRHAAQSWLPAVGVLLSLEAGQLTDVADALLDEVNHLVGVTVPQELGGGRGESFGLLPRRVLRQPGCQPGGADRDQCRAGVRQRSLDSGRNIIVAIDTDSEDPVRVGEFREVGIVEIGLERLEAFGEHLPMHHVEQAVVEHDYLDR
jgi:acetate kinase